jgi:2-keto-4-pentenoate hydratase/2-oxohepta-3-ene-1,7-dioic acid hydratase in catechol pathway
MSYEGDGGLRSAVQVGDLAFDTQLLAGRATLRSGQLDWTSARAILAQGPEAWARLEEAAQAAVEDDGRRVDTLRVGPPVPDPEKIICLGLNYRDHASEAGLALPEAPMLFAKYRNSLGGPEDDIVLPAASSVVDYEAELAVVIGRPGKDVPEADALQHVAGVMALNDVSARDLQLQTSQWMAGKAIDTFAPCGPALVTLDEIADIQDLAVITRLNGTVVQDGTTSEMIFSVAATVAFLSRLMTLVPGDIIATGTPAGVGFKRRPPLLLTDGDIVEVEIGGGVGAIRNRVVSPVVPAAALAGTSIGTGE